MRPGLTLSAAVLLAACVGCQDNADTRLVETVDTVDSSTSIVSKATDDGKETADTKTGVPSPPDHLDAINYRNIRPVFWSRLYENGGKTLYCSVSFAADRDRGFNIEHVLPMSWVTRFLDCGSRKQCRRNSSLFNLIESDLHNLFPTRTTMNDARSSYSFGLIKGETRQFGDCDFEVDRQRRLVEPAESARGDVARAMLYMELTYGIPLFRGQRELLIDWAGDDPVDAEERRRNLLIDEIQNRRNPYIDKDSLDQDSAESL